MNEQLDQHSTSPQTECGALQLEEIDTDQAAAELQHLATVLAIGCDRATASHFVGRDQEEIDEMLASRNAMGRELRQAEARALVTHMRNVYEAAHSGKNWRASVWWLERFAPDLLNRKRKQRQRQRQEAKATSQTHRDN